MKKCILKIIVFTFLFDLLSCTKTEKITVAENVKESDQIILQQNQKEETDINVQPEKEEIVIDKNRFFIDEEWHPVKQNQFITRVKDELKKLSKNDVNESDYEDEFTTEFSLNDETKYFCLYHNIRNVKDFPIEDFEIYKYWGLMNVWCFLEKEGISVLWTDNTGAILIMGTEDPHYSTKRGIHVGDSAEKILEAYENDCTVEEYNYDEEKWETVSKKEKSGMWLLKSNECISLNAGNMIDEEVMTLSYMLEDGIVYKIVIQCGN